MNDQPQTTDSFFRRVLRAGQRPEFSKSLNQRIWVTNIFALCLGTVILPYTVIFPALGATWLGLLCLPQTLFYYSVPWLNRRGWINFSRISFGILAHIIVLGFAIVLGPAAHIHLLFGLTISYGVLFYTHEESRMRALAVGLSISSAGLFFAYQVLDGTRYLHLSEGALSLIGGLLAITTLCLLFLISWFFHVSTHLAETEIQRHLSELGVIVDERTRALSAQQALLLSVVESIDDGILVMSKTGEVQQFNERFLHIWGHCRESIQAGRENELLASAAALTSDPEEFLSRGREILMSGEHSEDTLSLNNGIILERYSCPLEVNGVVTGHLWVFRDVTRRKQLEELMVHTEKMVSVGGMSAGIAHEINNPLAGILQSAQVTTSRLLEDNAKNREVSEQHGVAWESLQAYIDDRGIRGLIDNIRSSGVRASKIVGNLLNFARRSDELPGLCHVPDLLEKSIEFSSADYNPEDGFDFQKISIERHITSDLPSIFGFGDKLQQVFVNILRNGAHAMAESKVSNPRFIIRVERPDSAHVSISFNNNGSEIPEHIRRRVFEPFFTTKKVGQGTGLGLSVSYFIITDEHSGTMFVESTPQDGTTFTIVLPIRPARPSRLPSPASAD